MEEHQNIDEAEGEDRQTRREFLDDVLLAAHGLIGTAAIMLWMKKRSREAVERRQHAGARDQKNR